MDTLLHLQLTTIKFVNTGCYIINWYDSWGDGWTDFNGTQGYILTTDANGDTLGYAPNAIFWIIRNLNWRKLYVSQVVLIQLLSITMLSTTIDDGSCIYCTDNFLTLNMYDSFGDGWNGNTLTMTNSAGAMLVSQTLLGGSDILASLCLVDDCYTVDVGGGSWQKLKFHGK